MKLLWKGCGDFSQFKCRFCEIIVKFKRNLQENILFYSFSCFKSLFTVPKNQNPLKTIFFIVVVVIGIKTVQKTYISATLQCSFSFFRKLSCFSSCFYDNHLRRKSLFKRIHSVAQIIPKGNWRQRTCHFFSLHFLLLPHYAYEYQLMLAWQSFASLFVSFIIHACGRRECGDVFDKKKRNSCVYNAK